MAGYGFLVAATGLFIAAHILPRRLGWKAALTARYGEKAYGRLYGVGSTLAFVACIVAMRLAPVDPLWSRDAWMLWVPPVVMPLAVVLFLFGLRTPNDLSIPVRADAFDPQNPGFLAVTRHPLPWAFALWSLAHMVALSDVRALIFFGSMFVISVAAPVLLDRRNRRRLGADAFAARAAGTSFLPFAGILSGRLKVRWRALFCWSVVEAVMAFLLLLVLHMNMLRIDPLPLTPVFHWWGGG